MDMGSTNGLMEGNIKEIGKIIKWMEQANLLGQMAGNIKGNI